MDRLDDLVEKKTTCVCIRFWLSVPKFFNVTIYVQLEAAKLGLNAWALQVEKVVCVAIAKSRSELQTIYSCDDGIHINVVAKFTVETIVSVLREDVLSFHFGKQKFPICVARKIFPNIFP